MTDIGRLVIRPFRDDADYERMAAIIRATNLQDGIPWVPTAEHLRMESEGNETLDPRVDIAFAEIDDVQVAVAGVDRTMRDGVATFETWGHVHPTVRRQGIGRRLLDRNLARIRERVALESPDQPVQGGGFVEDAEVGHRALLAGAGFEIVRHFFLMRRPDLADIPDVPLPDGFEIRPVSPDEHRAILDAENEAFRDHWNHREPGPDDFRLTFAKPELRTDLWVVAWDGDEVAGVVQSWIWPEENAALGVQRGWLEHISVRRPWRRRGLARAITARALTTLRDAGMADAMLGVDSESPTGALGLYESLGFEVHSRSAAYHLDLPR
jgi:mycothiol synthase